MIIVYFKNGLDAKAEGEPEALLYTEPIWSVCPLKFLGGSYFEILCRGLPIDESYSVHSSDPEDYLLSGGIALELLALNRISPLIYCLGCVYWFL